MRHRLLNYIKDTECPETNFRLGIEYYNVGQTASAAVFLLRAADRSDDSLFVYRCLIVLAQCFMKQGRRIGTVEDVLTRAIELFPDRAEAYYVLSRYLQENNQLKKSYFYASIGLRFAKDYKGLDLDTEYLGRYCLLFQKAVGAWWVGLRKEAQEIMLDLWENYDLDPTHVESVKNNIINIGYPDRYNRYTSQEHYRLRMKFPGSEIIQRNYSQVFQDMFVLGMLRGKKRGTYYEIGSSYSKESNNTYLLEKEFDWIGVSVDKDIRFKLEWSRQRFNPVIFADAVHLDHTAILQMTFGDVIDIDYLQVDCHPASVTLECLKALPWDVYRFAVITFEHDHYSAQSERDRVREQSREFLRSAGYVLLVSDVCCLPGKPFEDWWVHPKLIDKEIVEKTKASFVNDPKDYIYLLTI